MSRRGCRASSPRVAAASNPAKERNPKTTPRNSAEVSVPGGTLNTDQVKVWPPGAVPASRRTSTIALITRISATVAPSTDSSTLVPPAGGRDGQRERAQQRHGREHERRPGRRVRPDADGGEEVGAEDPGRGRGDHAVEAVGAEQPEAADQAGAGAERGADEGVDR